MKNVSRDAAQSGGNMAAWFVRCENGKNGKEKNEEGKCRRVKWRASVRHWGRDRDVLRTANEIPL